jgi:hypothetical protein
MPATIEYRGLTALEYAAQTGAQLLRRRREGDVAEPIDPAIAYALWKLGAAHQVLCIAVDHRALARAQPYPGWAYALKRPLKKVVRVARFAVRLLGNLGDQLALFVRVVRVRSLPDHVET